MAIHLENEFTVPASADEVWAFLLDPRRVAPCMPGAELTEVLNDNQYKGKVHIKMGPVSLSFNGDVDILERDDAAKRMVMKATGAEAKGKGQANATVTSWLESTSGGTRMWITQDIDLSGPLAQYGRGMIQDVSGSLMDEFAGRIATKLMQTAILWKEATKQTGNLIASCRVGSGTQGTIVAPNSVKQNGTVVGG